MYARHEASLLKQEFWTIFGKYMSPIPSSEGEKINWINYKTGQKYIFFRLNADQTKAWIGIELMHDNPVFRQLYFSQLLQFKNALTGSLGKWTWQENDQNENGREVSRIYSKLNGCSIFKKEDWPGLISFFKLQMLALDEFWNSVKYSLESL